MWPNAYRDRNTALTKQLLENEDSRLFFAPDSSQGYIDSLGFLVNGIPATLEPDQEHGDIAKLVLPSALMPGDFLLLESPFRVKIPSAKYSRLGHIGQSYMISQWYPKPAVYDRDGWHQMPYLDQGEFYSEYGSFRVSISLPANYRVAATGQLITASEKAWLHSLSDSLARMNDLETDNHFPASEKEFKTIVFEQDSIHDFAWFADKRYYVRHSQFQIEGRNDPIDAWSFFTGKNTMSWASSNQYIEHAIQFYSQRLGTYPYSQYTVADGTLAAGDGMEYPMLTVVKADKSAFVMESVIAHEAGHTWLYGILGSNERSLPWMDEGFNSYFELQFTDHYYPGKLGEGMSELNAGGVSGKLMGTSKMTVWQGYDLMFRFSGYNNSDQPADLPAPEYTFLNYGTVIYVKTALAFDFLESYLGEKMFDQCVHAYYDQWKFKHPSPSDLQSVFETVSGRDLDWFFQGMIESNKATGYKIIDSKKTDAGYTLKLSNTGTFPVPFTTAIDTSEMIWHEGFTNESEITLPAKKGERIFINRDYSGLTKQEGYGYRVGAMLKRMPSIKCTIFPKLLQQPGKANINVLPVVAWNRYNNLMTGAWISNFSYIPDAFEFSFTPLYDWKNNALAGTASMAYQIWPIEGPFSMIRFELPVKAFSYAHNDRPADGEPGVQDYKRVAPGVQFIARKKTPRSSFNHGFGFRYSGIWQDEIQYTQVDTDYVRKFVNQDLYFANLNYFFSNSRILDPFSGNVNFEAGDSYVKAGIEFNYRFSYAKKNSGIDVRFFGGAFLDENESQLLNYNFRMSGWEGSHDYKYEEYYFGRTDDHGLWKQQFMIRDGGFKAPTVLGQTGKWLAALNITADLPLPLPIKVFGDLGTYSGISDVFDDIDNKVMFDAGLALVPIRGVLEVYFPLFASDDIERVWDTNNITFAEKIRFVFNIKALDPYAIRNRLNDTTQF